jgi:hypothetical protein
MFAITTRSSAKPKHRITLTRFLTHCRDWLGTCSDTYAAARMYEELRYLSETELNRRGLSRTTLAADLLRGRGRV